MSECIDRECPACAERDALRAALAAAETERDSWQATAEVLQDKEALSDIVAAQTDDLAALRAELDDAHAALIDCAEIAGVDGEAIEAARSGALKFPSIEVFAVNAVQALKDDAEEAEDARAALRATETGDA